MTYTVTRQHQWPDGAFVVEVSGGGIDYTNPDALCAKYPGEFEEFADPREAVETAIDICRAWRRDGKRSAKIGVGSTGGYTMPFDPSTFAGARSWAKHEWESLDKCAQCGEVLGEKRNRYGSWELGEFDCCSEYCAEKRYAPITEDEEAVEC